jgi:hypothetical protein
MRIHISNDLDTTAVALTVTKHLSDATKHRIMDEMLQTVNRDGLVQVYFDPLRPRIGVLISYRLSTVYGRQCGY